MVGSEDKMCSLSCWVHPPRNHSLHLDLLISSGIAAGSDFPGFWKEFELIQLAWKCSVWLRVLSGRAVFHAYSLKLGGEGSFCP